MKKHADKRRRAAMHVLRLPDLDFAKRALLNTLGSPESKLLCSPKRTHRYSPKESKHSDLTCRQSFARDDDDESSRCQRLGRDHAESAAGGSGRIRE
jgi:hypothetical protein